MISEQYDPVGICYSEFRKKTKDETSFILQNQKWIVITKFALVFPATEFAFEPAKHSDNHNRWFYMRR
jgi:hypothetical protein